MIYRNFHLILSVWTFLSISVNIVTPKCSTNHESNDFDSDWICQNMTLSNDTIIFDLENINKTEIESIVFFNVSGEFNIGNLENVTVAKKILIGNSTFEKIELKTNQLRTLMIIRTVLPNFTLANCCPYLEKLKINAVEGLRDETVGFVGLKRLKTLYIKNQIIKEIRRNTFKGLSRLKQLSLINNSIETIQADSFAELTNLIELNIDDDKIILIDHKVFEPLTKLTSLTLYAENLEVLPIEIFRNQRKITNIGLPVKTWANVNVEKLPEMFPQLSFFSIKNSSVSHDVKTSLKRQQLKLYELLFRESDT